MTEHEPTAKPSSRRRLLRIAGLFAVVLIGLLLAAPWIIAGTGLRDWLINKIMGTGLGTQPAYADVYSELASVTASGARPDNLIDRLIAGGSNTRAISKGVCAAMLGNATTLVQ